MLCGDITSQRGRFLNSNCDHLTQNLIDNNNNSNKHSHLAIYIAQVPNKKVVSCGNCFLPLYYKTQLLLLDYVLDYSVLKVFWNYTCLFNSTAFKKELRKDVFLPKLDDPFSKILPTFFIRSSYVYLTVVNRKIFIYSIGLNSGTIQRGTFICWKIKENSSNSTF